MSLHPDLIRTFCQQVTYTAAVTERYEVFPDAAYVLSARLVGLPGVTGFAATLYTSPSPDNAGDDEGKIPLLVDEQGRPDDYFAGGGDYSRGVFFENGIYAATNASTDGDDAFLQVIYVPRKHYCPAFPYPEETLRECWDEAHNKGRSETDPEYIPFLTNFWNFERENPEEDGGSSGGGGTPGGSGIGVPIA